MIRRLSAMAQSLMGRRASKKEQNVDGWVEKSTMDGVPFYVNINTHEVTWDRPAVFRTTEDMQKEAGEWTWVPHPDDLWQPARKVETLADGSIKYETQDKQTLVVAADGTYVDKQGVTHKVEFWPLKLSWLRTSENDLIMLDHINKGMIMYSLKSRYMGDVLYTWVGASRSVLISVNPYKHIPNLYGDEEIQKHRNRSPNREITPHVFDIANDSYDSLLFDFVNQSVLISGESGAGKTEATKQCLRFIATVAGSENNVEVKILQANPVLEAFGNAKTIRNNNSSRFGKWIEVYISPGKRNITGAKITNYLLEKSRLVHQQGGERNFHIFYQMATDAELSGKYSIGTPTSYRYLSSGITTPINGLDDKEDFVAMKKAMVDIGFTSEEMNEAFKLAAFVLHLGNITFKEKPMANNVKGSEIESDDPLNKAKSLLGVDTEALRKVLLTRSITVRGETSVIPLDPAAARAGADSFAKGVYGRLFDWLVTRINDALKGKEGPFIGILDIFGFEIFESNSFEQLCINYTNEKLQQLFNKTTFKEEEALYEAQQIKYSHVEFIDNQIVLDLIEQRPSGILPLLDDECLVPEGSDAKFMLKLEQAHGSHPKFQTDKKRKMTNTLAFEIKHYAGIVLYDASAFSDKNKDTFFADCYELCGKSTDNLTKALFPKRDTRIQTKSLSTLFRDQLSTLMEKLNSTRTRYIRCIKPNDKMAANDFNVKLAIEQLTYSGVFEAVQIRKQGFPFRWTYHIFATRYRCINPNHKYVNRVKGKEDLEGAKALCREILDVSKQNFKEVQFGTTMVLYHASEHRVLTLLRNLSLEVIIPRLQRYMRGFLPREMKRRLLKGEKGIKEALDRKCDYPGLKAALENAEPIVGNFRRLFKGYRARNIPAGEAHLADLQKWIDMEQELKVMFEKDPNKVYNDFRSVLARAAAIKHIPQTPAQIELVNNCTSKLDSCEVGLIDAESQKVMALPKPEHKRDIMQRFVNVANKHAFTSPTMDLVIQTLKEYERIDLEVKDAMRAYSRARMVQVVADAKVYEYKTAPLDEMKKLTDKFDQIDKDCEEILKNVNRPRVLAILDEAKKFRHNSEWVSKVDDAEKEYQRIDWEARNLFEGLTKDRMVKVLEDAHAYHYTSPDLEKLKPLLEEVEGIDRDCESALTNINRENVFAILKHAREVKYQSEWVSKMDYAEKEYFRLEQEAKDALASKVRERMLTLVADANIYNYVPPEMDDIKARLELYDRLDNDCKVALEEMNKEKLDQVFAESKESSHASEWVDKVSDLIKEFERVMAESQAALDAKNPPRIIKVLADARAIKYTSPVIDAIIEMIANYERIDSEGKLAITNMDKKGMQKAVAEAAEINHVSEIVDNAKNLLELPEKEFVTKELQIAEAQKDKARALHRKIRLMYMGLDEEGGKYANILVYPELRTPEDFAASAGFEKDKPIEPYFLYSEAILPTSLTKSKDSKFKTLAIGMNKNLLTYTGEVKGNVDEAASLFLTTGNGSAPAKNEMFCQLIRHLTENPNEQSRERGWTLLGLACRYVSPTPIMEKYVMMFVKTNGKNNGAKWFSAMNECKYGGGKPPGPGGVAEATRQFHKLEETGSRFSIHGDAYTGPTLPPPTTKKF